MVLLRKAVDTYYYECRDKKNRPQKSDLFFCLPKSRKLGDSNPRYGYPHGSLANCWFQPLTQTSLRNRFRRGSLAGTKVITIIEPCKF